MGVSSFTRIKSPLPRILYREVISNVPLPEVISDVSLPHLIILLPPAVPVDGKGCLLVKWPVFAFLPEKWMELCSRSTVQLSILFQPSPSPLLVFGF